MIAFQVFTRDDHRPWLARFFVCCLDGLNSGGWSAFRHEMAALASQLALW